MNKKGLIILIVCFAGLCAYLFTVFYGEAEKTAIRQLNEEQKIYAKQAALGIEDFFASWTGILNSLSKIDAIINSDAEGKRLMTLFYKSHHEQIRSITRVDESGRILHTVPYMSAIGSDISEQKHMREILRDHKPVVSDVFKTVQSFDAVALHLPVFRGATFKGTIAIVIDFEKLARRYLEIIKIGKTGYAWVISSDGTMLYSPVPGFTGESIFDTGRDFPTMISMAKDMLQGREGIATYVFDKIGDRTVAPVKKYAVYRPIHIANSFWSIVVASPEDEVLSSLASFRNKLILVVGMILVGGVLFSIISVKAWLIVAEESKRRRAEEELRESEQYNRLLFELSPIGLTLSRMDGKFIDVNPAYAKIIGRTVEETLALTYWEITPEKYAEQEEQQLLLLRTTGRYGPYEKEYIHKEGHPVPVRLQGLLIERGGEQYIWSSVEDITDRKGSEALLHESERKYRELVENANSIILRWSRDGNVTFINEYGQKFFGYSEAEILGQHVVGTIVPETESTGRDLRPLMDQICADPKAFEQNLNENMRRNGERIWIAWTNKVVLDEQGQIKEILSIGSDVTAQKKTTEERNRLFNLSIDMLCVSGFDGYFKELNPAWEKTLGWTNEELMSKPYLEFVHPDDRESTINTAKGLSEGKTIITFDNRYLCRDGSYRWISWNSFPLVNENLIFAIARNITERKEAEEKSNHQLQELKRWYDVTINREGRVQELKQEVNELLMRLNEPVRYASQYEEIKSPGIKSSKENKGSGDGNL